MTKLVVNPNNSIGSPFAAIETPLWAGLCASYLDADILDAEALGLSLDETEETIRKHKPESVLIVVMGNNPSVSSTPKMPVAESLAARVQDLNVSLTGIHPIAAGSRYKVVRYPFSGLPSMPWDRLPMLKYRAHNWHCLDGSPRTPYASVYTSLGCPYSCYYCNIHALYPDRKVQFRPLHDLIVELDTLVDKYHVKNIKLWDELFTLNESRVFRFCEFIQDYDLNIWAYARLDSVTPLMLRAMKQAGINWLAYGFESMRDRKVVNRTNEIIDITRDAGINIIANFMFGLPNETSDDWLSSLDWAQKKLFEYVNFYDARPYPGSQWYEDKGYVFDDWNDYNQYGRNRSEFRDMAFKSYFMNPHYINHIQNKFGWQAVIQIKEMLDWRLPSRNS